MKNILILKSVISEFDRELEGHLNSLDANLSFRTVTYDNLIIKIDKGKINIYDLNFKKITADIFYFRTWEKNQEIASTISHYCLQEGIPFYDSYLGSIKNGGKLLQMGIFSRNNIRVPKTIYIPNRLITNNFEFIKKSLGLPVIIKSTNGRKGKDNYMIKDISELLAVIPLLDINENYIIQEFIPNKFDYRYLVLNYKVVLAYKRIRKNDDSYKNNISQGAQIEYLEKENYDYSNIAIKTATLLGREVCGVDIVVSDNDGFAYVFEANPSPGIYSLDDPSDWSRVDALHSLFK